MLIEHTGSEFEPKTMITFFITAAERRRAQGRAAELDIGGSNPPGQYPYVWDNRMGCVNRWYDYGSSADRLGTIYFEPDAEADGQRSGLVECTTDITCRPAGHLRHVNIPDPDEHQKLVKFFFRELLDINPGPRGPEPSTKLVAAVSDSATDR